MKTCCNSSGRFISNNTALRPKTHDESVMLVLVSDVFGNASGEVKHTVLAVCELRIVTYHVTYSFRCASALPACRPLKRVWKVHVPVRRLERVKGFEPSTPTLARLCSTPELHPRCCMVIAGDRQEYQGEKKAERIFAPPFITQLSTLLLPCPVWRNQDRGASAGPTHLLLALQ